MVQPARSWRAASSLLRQVQGALARLARGGSFLVVLVKARNPYTPCHSLLRNRYKELSPVWRETYAFEVREPDASLEVTFSDYDLASAADFMGRAYARVGDYADRQPHREVGLSDAMTWRIRVLVSEQLRSKYDRRRRAPRRCQWLVLGGGTQ